MIGIKIEAKDVERQIEEMVDKLVGHCVNFIEAHAIEAAPKDTGYMASQIKGRKTGRLKGEVVSPVWYSGYVEYGTENIKVGTRKQPREEWDALVKRGAVGSGQTMPFLRPAAYKLEVKLSSLSADEWRRLLR